MDVDLARTLVAIVETGSFKEAANKLYLTQSAVSARIKILEDAVGKRLLERSKSGVALTPSGDAYRCAPACAGGARTACCRGVAPGGPDDRRAGGSDEL